MSLRRISGRHHLAALLVLAACTSCAAADHDPQARPLLADDIRIAHCLDVIERQVKRDPLQCPGFLIEPLGAGLQMCREAGGRLVPVSPANIWKLDVNGDGQQEFLFEYEGNVSCEGAWSLFSCGSLGCPKILYEEQQSAWRPIAGIYADTPQSIEILDGASGKNYRELRVGCSGEQTCAERWHYLWKGQDYERSYAQVRGFRVEFAASVHGLHPVTGEIALLATPASDGQIIGRYGADTEVAVIGTAAAADYYYVSPCNACESGFVRKSAVRIP